MEETNSPKIHPPNNEAEEEWRNLSQHLIQTLPKTVWRGILLHLYDGFWIHQLSLKRLLYFKKHFKPYKNDILLASFPKSGTNWLKALTFTLVNRSRYSLKETPMLTSTVHQLVPFFDVGLTQNDHFPDFDSLTQPRVFATHAPYPSLPSSIKDSQNKIVYICRNPFDSFKKGLRRISYTSRRSDSPIPLEESTLPNDAFDGFFQETHAYGPFWDHILGYWKVSNERPDKVLFLKYENLKKNNIACIKKLATFLGFPFSEEEEKRGLVQEISDFCGFENMKNLDVNKTGKEPGGFPHTAYFRKGQVGDFRNYLCPDKILKMEELIQQKIGQFGLSFDFS